MVIEMLIDGELERYNGDSAVEETASGESVGNHGRQKHQRTEYGGVHQQSC
jgi:hypothetical protein